MTKARVLYWFRTDLRLHDSPALAAALKLNPEVFYPVWTWDPHYVYSQQVGPNRWQFLLDSMKDVSESLTELNSDSQLFVVRGPPATVLPALWKEWGITDIVWEKDDDSYTAERDATISSLAEKAGVKVHVVLGHTLYDSAEIIKAGKGSVPQSYQAFRKLVDKLPKPSLPIPPPTSLPSPGPTTLTKWKRSDHAVDPWRLNDLNREWREEGSTERDLSFESFAGPEGDFAVPTMEELGMVATSEIRGGERRALQRFEEWMDDNEKVAEFKKPQTSPAAFEPPSTTQLSPHLKFGTLSPRTFYHRVLTINRTSSSTPSEPPESLIGQLLWREFFHAQQAATPFFTRIRGNKVSRYISWALQTRYDEEGEMLSHEEMEKAFEREEPEAWERFKAWKEGRTGFPWIDALMRQVRETGWMHHLGRHSVACFLTRGQLYVSWERGAEVFDRYLIDWDPALNSANWQWLSASAFFHSFYRVYSPATYGQKSDPTGALIRRFCPELAGFSDKHIYTPWSASKKEQEQAGCVIGEDYPERIVDEKEAKEKCLKLMKAAYDAKLHGDDPRVLDGTADEYLESFLPGKVKPTREEGISKDGKRKAQDDSKAGGGKGSKKAKQTTLDFGKD
ncbi:FAD binding domain of DNA photolyase-domain-containing protein [Leucosporidium creatinivorum]|uniref:FAD binding domain of DNA photolyase-domain-containing protein n=1 Tax=Leucosporidium creatinivorum TaxID=106004 RepID=A0A1Y2G0N0_9BASI|nr:FAD binding domain of DNA photolyase-domain-containing protein [Leucosporidium creatinivorum]